MQPLLRGGAAAVAALGEGAQRGGVSGRHAAVVADEDRAVGGEVWRVGGRGDAHDRAAAR